MKPTRSAFGFVLLAAAVAAFPASAELYKWVDRNGVTNYSDEPPADPALARSLLPVDDRLSVYKPDAALDAAMRRARVEPEPRSAAAPAASGPSVGIIGVPAPPVSDPCAGRLDCGVMRQEVYPYVVPVFPVHRFPPRLHQPQLPAGAIAGTVTGSTGFIPGNSATAASGGVPRFSRPAAPARMNRLP